MLIKIKKVDAQEHFWKDPVVQDMMNDKAGEINKDTGGSNSLRNERTFRGGPFHGLITSESPNYQKVDFVFPEYHGKQRFYHLYAKTGRRGYRMRRLYRYEPCEATLSHENPKIRGAWPADLLDRVEHVNRGVSHMGTREVEDPNKKVKISPTWSKKYD